MKALVGAFNQEKALVEAYSVIVKTSPMVRLQMVTTYCMPGLPGSLGT